MNIERPISLDETSSPLDICESKYAEAYRLALDGLKIIVVAGHESAIFVDDCPNDQKYFCIERPSLDNDLRVDSKICFGITKLEFNERDFKNGEDGIVTTVGDVLLLPDRNQPYYLEDDVYPGSFVPYFRGFVQTDLQTLIENGAQIIDPSQRFSLMRSLLRAVPIDN